MENSPLAFEGLPNSEGSRPGKIGGSDPVAHFLVLGSPRLGLPRIVWLIEVSGLAYRNQGLSWPGPMSKSAGFKWPSWPRARQTTEMMHFVLDDLTALREIGEFLDSGCPEE